MTNTREVDEVLKRALVCRLAFSQDDRPYVVPLAFGCQPGVLYFHSAREGKKIDMIRANPNVCFEVDIDHELVISEEACSWSMKYNSVIGFGTARLVEDPAEKRKALETIMDHYSQTKAPIREEMLDTIWIIKVEIENATSKARPKK